MQALATLLPVGFAINEKDLNSWIIRAVPSHPQESEKEEGHYAKVS